MGADEPSENSIGIGRNLKGVFMVAWGFLFFLNPCSSPFGIFAISLARRTILTPQHCHHYPKTRGKEGEGKDSNASGLKSGEGWCLRLPRLCGTTAPPGNLPLDQTTVHHPKMGGVCCACSGEGRQ